MNLIHQNTKRLFVTSLKRAGISILVMFLSGCAIPSVDHWAKTGIGQPISVSKQLQARPNSYASKIGWKEKIYMLENGNMVFVDPIRDDCFVNWEVNPDGIIVGYKIEGKNCY